jgi:hypothetical protein
LPGVSADERLQVQERELEIAAQQEHRAAVESTNAITAASSLRPA